VASLLLGGAQRARVPIAAAAEQPSRAASRVGARTRMAKLFLVSPSQDPGSRSVCATVALGNNEAGGPGLPCCQVLPRVARPVDSRSRGRFAVCRLAVLLLADPQPGGEL